MKDSVLKLSKFLDSSSKLLITSMLVLATVFSCMAGGTSRVTSTDRALVARFTPSAKAHTPLLHIRPSLAQALARPDAKAVLDPSGKLLAHGPHIHPSPVYYVRQADGSFNTVSVTSSVATGASQSPSGALPLPSDIGPTVDLSSRGVWTFKPSPFDVQQYSTADCYILADVAGLLYHSPWYAYQLVQQRPDGLYSVTFHRSGKQVLTVSGILAATGVSCQPSPDSGDIGAMLLEKAYAYYRYGANTYSSLNWGSPGTAFNDLGCTVQYLTVNNTTPTALASTFGNGFPASLLTIPGTPQPFIASHVYAILKSDAIPGTNDAWLTLYNPWGIDGGSFANDTNSGDGVIVVLLSSIKPYTSSIVVVTGFAADMPRPIAGDCNLDGHVTIADALILQNNFNKPGDWCDGDFDNDRKVAISDWLLMQQNFNK